ncbi:MAG: glycoside hydrolase [Actinomycetota bacterium]|nr:glycoside hydrolase [Actinomycetota bacterium]
MPSRVSSADDDESPAKPGTHPPDASGGGRRLLIPVLLGLTLVLMGVGLVLAASSFEKPAKAGAAATNAPVNAGARTQADISAHNSPSLVANPRNAANLVVANKIDSPRFSCALHVSFDGGGHWNQTPIPLPAGEEPKCYAPDVTFAADGALYLSFVTLKGRANAPNAVWLVRSPDGGQTLSDPIRTRGPLKFQVRLAADPVAPQRLYMTWLDAREVGLFKFITGGNAVRAARSDDGGRTWSSPNKVSGPASARAVAPSPVVGPKGELYVLYLDLGEDRLDYEGGHRGQGGEPYDGTWRLMMARSTDRGATWKESAVEDKIVPTERFIAFTPPTPSLAVDRRSGAVYAAFHDGRRGNADVYLWTLAPGEGRWGDPVRVNDTPGTDDSSQLLPKLSVAPDGRLDVLYYDRRVDPENLRAEASLQSSFDGGRTFLPRVRLSDRPFDSRIGYGSERGMPDLGTRLGLVSMPERALGVWTDTRSGTQASSKQDLARGVAAFSPPEDLSPTLKTLLRFAGVLLALAGLALVAYALARRGQGNDARRRRPGTARASAS